MPPKKNTPPPSQENHQPRDSSASDAQSASQPENVSVCVRVKPIASSPLSDIDIDTPTPTHRKLSQKENSNRFGSWLINHTQSSISLSPSHPIIDRRGTGTSEAINGSEGYEFKLDQIFDPYSSTSDLYRASVQSLIETCVKDGYNVTVFAYGQTGSGKTFTMMGSKHGLDEESLGVIPRAVTEVFDVIASDLDREYLLRVSYLEIYNEGLKDLLAADQPLAPANRLTIHEATKGRVHVNGIREEVVTHPMQVLDALARGEKARHVGATDWNERSSRSHTVFTMTVESRPKSTISTDESSPTQISQLNLIDLAGSESAASSTARRKEGAFINKSLLALSNVISKLSTLEPHIPYRDSKLTRLLQTSLSGNAKVVVICTISADGRSVAETLSTLRFARRAKMVITKAQRGTILDDKSALLQAYQREIMSLKAQLQENSQALSITTTPGSALAELNAEKSKAESELQSLRFERIRLQEQIEHMNRRILTSHTIQLNVQRAHSLQTPVSPTRRRIVSNQMPQPPKKLKGRVTDIGGMMGMLGIGLSGSAYISNGARLSEEKQTQFQRELQLEKELQQVRNELDQLKQERSESPQELSQSGMDLLKKQIRALEADKENLPVGINEQDERTNAIKVFEDETEMMISKEQRQVDCGTTEIQNLTRTITPLQTKSLTEEEQITELGDSMTINSQNGHLQHLEHQLESLRNEHDRLKCEHSILLQDSELQKSNFAVELSSMKEEKERYASDSHFKQELISKLESEVNNSRTETEDLTRMQQERTASLEKERSDFITQVAELQAELSTSKKEHEELISNQREQLLRLEAEKSDFQHIIKQLRSQLAGESASLQAATDQLDLAQQPQQQELEECNIKLEKERAEAQIKIQELQSQLDMNVNRSDKEKEDLISNHQEQIIKMQTENSDALAQAEELKSRLESELMSLREKHEKDMSTLKEQLALMEVELSSRRDQPEELESKTFSELNNSNQAENEHQLSSHQQLANLEAARLEAQNQYETSKSVLEAELDSMRKEKEEQLSAQQEEITRLQSECIMLKELKSTHSVESQWLKEKSDHILVLENQIEELKSEYSQAQAQIHELKTVFDSEVESLRRNNEELISSQKDQLEKLKVERSEALAKIDDLIATQSADQYLTKSQEELTAQLSKAQVMIDDLTASNNEKEKYAHTLQDRVSALESELSQLGGKVTELTNEKADAEENVKKLENDHVEQLKNLEVEIAQLKISLEDERSARLNTDVEFSEKTKSLESELASLSTLQTDTSSLKAKMGKLEQRLSLERNKSQEKELEFMQLIQERDQARGQIENLEMILSDEDSKAKESIQSVIHEWESKLNEAEKLTDESRSKIVELNNVNETLEQKLRLFESETPMLRRDIEKLRTERTNQEIQQSKFERLASRLQEDLEKMQEKEKESIGKIESIVAERCAATSSRLHETYNSKLVQLEQSNLKLETHIKSLESHLASVGNGQRQQTTAESMEAIVDLQSTIEDQNREIRDLRSELESVKTLSNCPLPSAHNKRSDHDHYHQSTEDELNRLYHIIDEQEKRLSDAKTGLSKWQARVRSQTEIISKLKITSESDSEQRKFANNLNRRSNSSLDHPAISTSARSSTTFNNLNCSSPTKTVGLSPLIGSGTRSSVGHLLSSSSSLNVKADGNNSPRPLPVPESFISSIDDDDAQRRKHRRRTIEKDMARLKDENVVEKKINSLLSSSTFKDSTNLGNYPENSMNNNNGFRTTMHSSPLHRNSISTSSHLFKPNNNPTSSSGINNHSSLSSTGLKNNAYKRQSGQISPTASTFSSISSQRGYYE